LLPAAAKRDGRFPSNAHGLTKKMIGAIRIVLIPLHDQNPLKIIPFQRVTLGIILVRIAVFVLQWAMGPTEASNLIKSFALVPAVLLGPADTATGVIPTGLTLVAAAFLHGSWPHLIGNMLLLWVFGDNVEDSMGHLRFFAFYSVLRSCREPDPCRRHAELDPTARGGERRRLGSIGRLPDVASTG